MLVLMAPRPPVQAEYYTPARPRAPSCAEGGVADSPGGAFLEPHTRTDAGGYAAYFSVIGTNRFRCVGAISRLGRLWAVAGVGM